MENFRLMYVALSQDLDINAEQLPTLATQNSFNFGLGLARVLVIVSGPGSSVGIATDMGLDGPGSNPGGDEIFRPSRLALRPTQPAVNGYRVFPGGKVRPEVLLTTHPLLVPRSWKSRAIPLPTLWATQGL